MKLGFRFDSPRSLLRLACLTVLLLAGCEREGRRVQEIVYVSAPQAVLRDHISAVFTKRGLVKNGERLDVLERERRFLRVRTASGVEGWIEQRYVVPEQVYQGFEKLRQESQKEPVQGTGTTRHDTNLHLEPGRETEHLFQLNQGSSVSLLERAIAPRIASSAPPPRPAPATDGSAGLPAAPSTVPSSTPSTAPAPPAAPSAVPAPAGEPAAPAMEDWWLVRDPEGQVGWVLSHMVDVDVPLEIAQYAEGQRLVAFFVLDQVSDLDKKVPQYLVLLTEPKDGMPFDFNQLRVFTWNLRRHRYETAYREHGLRGFLPVAVSQQDFGKEGTLPVFALRVKDDQGNWNERKYKLNTPIVRRILAPGEQRAPPARRSPKKTRKK